MAEMAKQRLVGALLVLAVIIIAAFFLVRSANDQVEESRPIALPEANTPIESVQQEVIESEQEALLDPHGLGQDVVAVIEDKAVLEAIAVESKAIADEKDQANEVKEAVEPAKVKSDRLKSVVDEKKLEPVKEVSEAVETEVKQPIRKPVEQAKVKPTKKGPAWTIQLASFGVKANAEGLQKSLTKLGYQSEMQAAENSKGKMIYRVRMGPMSDKQQVDKIVAKVKQHLKLEPQVIKSVQ